MGNINDDLSGSLFRFGVLLNKINAAQYLTPEQIDSEHLKAEERAELRRHAIADSRRTREMQGTL